ncbi:MAG: aconitase/3-isopropylmalate dehydratase large subunit family protein [Gemmatimonadota bacterium]|jgi:3-isopropylmalate dehydratase small subunit
MPEAIQGKVFVAGDDVNTDEIIPARYCATTDVASLGQYALEDLHPDKSPGGVPFQPGEYQIVLAGENFGCGSSREVAPVALIHAGVKAVVARSFARIFYRNAVNCGLFLSLNPEVGAGASTGDEIELDPSAESFWEGIAPIHRTIIEAGGLTAFNKSGKEAPQESASPRPMTHGQKILARAAGLDFVEPGMTVFAEVDKAITHELVLPVAAKQLEAAYGDGFKIWDREKLLVTVDHTVQIPLIRKDERSREMAEGVARFVEDQGLPHAFLPLAPFTSQGICHVLFPEEGLLKPDILLIGTDSHTCTYGAYGALSVGVGTTDLTEVMASGRIWLKVPESIRIDLSGRMPRGVHAKDVILHILSRVTMNGFTDAVVEFTGPGLEHLTEDDRSTIANMVVEGGGTCGLFPVGAVAADADAVFRKEMSFDLGSLEPYVAPPFKPDNGIPVVDLEPTSIDVAWIGSCTGGKLEDLAAAAEVVAGKRVAPSVRLIVSPATLRTMEKAGEQGYLRAFLEAGGQVIPPSCGACLGMGPGTLKEGEVGVFASNRNFKGRAGAGSVYLASPATVAASALEGKIADPRRFLS